MKNSNEKKTESRKKKKEKINWSCKMVWVNQFASVIINIHSIQNMALLARVSKKESKQAQSTKKKFMQKKERRREWINKNGTTFLRFKSMFCRLMDFLLFSNPNFTMVKSKEKTRECQKYLCVVRFSFPILFLCCCCCCC